MVDGENEHTNFNEEKQLLISEVKKQSREQIAKGTLTGIAFGIIVALAGWAFFLKPKLDDYISKISGQIIPEGAIIAFESGAADPCPSATWQLYDSAKGRFLVGAGQHDNPKITQYRLGEPGGEESVTLELPQIPVHRHEFTGGTLTKGNSGGEPAHDLATGGSEYIGTYAASGTISDVGGGEAHENRPPYLPVYFCIKKAVE